MLPDDVIAAQKPCLQQMVEAYEEAGGAMEVAPDRTSSYGVLDIESTDGPIVKAKGMVEKPGPGTAPSNVAVIGRYTLTSKVLQNLNKIDRGAGGEVQLTDAIAMEITQGRDVLCATPEPRLLWCQGRGVIAIPPTSFRGIPLLAFSNRGICAACC
jgi:UTP--glucose-1-phosphate uridylyltransferase